MSHQNFFRQRDYNWYILIANLSFLLVWYLANDGLAFWDDFTYLNFANQVNDRSFTITDNHFTSRVAMVYPVAFVIKFLGINAFTITAFPFFCGVLILNLFLWLGNRYHHWLGILTSVLFICDYRIITFITHLFPEMSMALFLFGGLVAYDLTNRGDGDHRLLALITSGLIFLAFLTKMTVILIGPLFLFLFVNDFWRKGKNKSYWLITVVLLVFFVLANGLWYREVYGDFFYRFSNISANHEATSKTFFDKDSLMILKRLTYLPLKGFLSGGFFISLLFAMPALLKLKKGDWKLNSPEKLWPVAVLFILGTWWFMSTNWKYYSPMPVDMRHLTFLIPIMLMAGGWYWIKTHLLSAIRYSKTKYLLLLFLLIPIYKILKSGDTNYRELEDVITSHISSESKGNQVFTDGLTSYGHQYFYDFEEIETVFIWFSEMNGAKPNSGDYLLVNPAYLNERYHDSNNLESFKNQVVQNGYQLIPISEGKVKLYQIQKSEDF